MKSPIHNNRIVVALLMFFLITASFVAGWVAKGVASRPVTEGIAPFNTTVIADRIALRVTAVREDETGAPPFVPQEGYRFVIPTIEVRNVSATTTELIPSLSFFVKDAAGEIYHTAIAPLRTGEFGGPMLPQDIVKQEMAFEVKKGAQGLTLYFTSGGNVVAERLDR